MSATDRTTEPPPALLAPLRARGFRYLAIGQLVSSAGNAMYKMALSWLLAATTGADGALIGLLAVFQFAPLLLFSGTGGALVDRLPRRPLLLTTQSAQAALSLAMAALAFAGTARTWHIYALTFASGLVTVVDNPARQRFLTDLVGERGLAGALGLYSALLNLGQIGGPVLAGLIAGRAHLGWVFAADAVTFLFVAAVVLRTPRPPRPARAAAAPPRSGGLRTGLREVRGNRHLTAAIAASVIVGAVGVQFTVTNTLMAYREFHLGPTGFALLPTLITAGCLLGALLAGRHPRPGGTTALLAAAGTGVASLATGLAPSYPVFAALMVPTGCVSMFFTTTTAVCLQREAAEQVRGRVLAVQTVAFYGGGPLGAFLVGLCGDHLGPRGALLAAGTVTVLLSAGFLVRHRRPARGGGQDPPPGPPAPLRTS
ncbi:hypothetical protein ADL22_23030 [Streptomyces sp. NRRL F-4489]|uniref:MFS transporter n=1 Tax=Streptomyces sp. NRRL F-4489 TaxID=1609095 RepID=UPI0007469A55|nr:MFS transporter [Streptomyces sp. NRRL F-4489]KUL36995.1 hypothetical protein ADL22_23030 [Streptomyces sp. NRRL F-4489]